MDVLRLQCECPLQFLPYKPMVRPLRQVVPTFPHHIRHRGVRKDVIFHEDSDYFVYLRSLRNACVEFLVKIWAYALMTNHVHLIAVPEDRTAISRALQRTHTTYAEYFNGKYGFVGHVWESRPQMSVMDDTYARNAIRYVERNPVRAGLVQRAEDYLWSSAAAHCGLRDDPLLSPNPYASEIAQWSEWLKIDQTEEELREIRSHLSSGRPWCTPEMLLQLEELTGKKLGAGKPGRPKKNIPNPANPLFE
jgi:REP-associated tyrosine transposase